VPRGLARAAFCRPLSLVLKKCRRGLQAIDWHEGLTAARAQIKEEISRLEQNAAGRSRAGSGANAAVRR
jgi:asparagine synthase (glutamine-hydrolysing)